MVQGATGRITRLPQSNSVGICGPVSPVAHWIYERGPSLNISVRPAIYSYPEKGTVSYSEIVKNAPPPFQNELKSELLYDKSWAGLLRPSWSVSRHSEARPELRHYSHTEIRCWANLGDQLANRLMADFYIKFESDLKQGFKAEEIDGWTLPATPEEAQVNALLHLQIAAKKPQTAQRCEDLGDECAHALLRPFPLGLPDAHRALMWAGRRDPNLVLDGMIRTPEYHFEQALQGGSFSVYYQYYQVPYPAH